MKTLPLALSVASALAISLNLNAQAQSNCAVPESSITHEVFLEWQEDYFSFATSYGYDVLGEKLDTNLIDFDIDSLQLDSLYEKCPTCKDVRIYFAAAIEGGIYSPRLLLVNVDDQCSDTEFKENGILLIAPDGGSGFISQTEATLLRANWGTYMTLTQVRIPNLISLTSYSYYRTTLEKAFANGTSTLKITLGRRVVDASETDYEFPSSPLDPVSFNLIISSIDESGNVLDNSHMNFARPCPKFCPPTSF